MKLYVCYSTGGNDHHACHKAFAALQEAGHEPEVRKSYGSKFLPAIFNRSEGRKLARETTGSFDLPLLVTDGGEKIAGSAEIVAWAAHNSAS